MPAPEEPPTFLMIARLLRDKDFSVAHHSGIAQIRAMMMFEQQFI